MGLDTDNIFPTAQDQQDEFFISNAEERLVPRIVRKASNETVNSTTAYHDDAELLMSLSANQTYKFQLSFGVDNGSSDPDFKYTVKGPTGATGTIVVTVYENSLVDTLWGSLNIDVLGGIGKSKFESTNVVNEKWFRVEGIVKTGSTAGDLIFSWGPKVSDADDCTVLAGSWLEVTRV